MNITCVACQSIFHFDKANIHATGSLVKCSKCHFIFMTQLTDYDELVCQDTHIHQSILNDLLEMESALTAKAVMNETSEPSNNFRTNRIRSISDYEEEALVSCAEDADYDDLPDLSAFEEMIDWDGVPQN